MRTNRLPESRPPQLLGHMR